MALKKRLLQAGDNLRECNTVCPDYSEKSTGDPTICWLYNQSVTTSHNQTVRSADLMISSEILIVGLVGMMVILMVYVGRGKRKS